MYPIDQTSILAVPFALPTSYIDALHREEAIAALDAHALKALSAEQVPPPASTAIDLSPVAQFQSALAQSHQLLDGLQPSGDNGSSNSSSGSSNAPLDALTGAAQNLVAAYNVLHTGEAAGTTAQAPLLNNLLHSVTNPNPAADASQAAGPATLADIGITLQAVTPAAASDASAALSLDAQALQTAYAANPQGTVALLNQTTGNFEQLGDQFAQQASIAAVGGAGNLSTATLLTAAAVPPAAASSASDASASATVAGSSADASAVPQDTLADLALTGALADNAAATADGVTQNQLDQLDQQQQQQQLNAARDAYSAQAATQQAQDKTLLTQQTAQLQSSEQLTQKQLSDASAKTAADAITQLRVTEQQQTSTLADTVSTTVRTEAAAAQARSQAAQSIADAAALTAAENAATTAEAAAQSPQAATELSVAAAIANAQAAVQSLPAQTVLPNPAAQDNTPANNGAAVPDPLAGNPALAAAIAAYRLGGAQAAVESRPAAPPPPKPQPVPKVEPVQPVDSASDAPPS